MKRIFLLLLCCMAVSITFSQNSRHKKKVTIDRSGYAREFETTDFAYSVNIGTAVNIYDQRTESILGNSQSFIIGFIGYYKDFFVMTDFRPVVVNLGNKNNILYFPANEAFEGNYEYTIFNFTYRFGKTYNLSSDFGIEPYVGYLRTNLFVQDDEIRKNLNIKKGNGFVAGVKFSKYFKQNKFGKYFVIYLDNNINYSGMKNIHPALGNSFYSIELGVALKSWIIQRIID